MKRQRIIIFDAHGTPLNPGGPTEDDPHGHSDRSNLRTLLETIAPGNPTRWHAHRWTSGQSHRHEIVVHRHLPGGDVERFHDRPQFFPTAITPDLRRRMTNQLIADANQSRPTTPSAGNTTNKGTTP